MTKEQIIIERVFYGEFEPFFSKSLWRMTEGNRERAFETIRATAKHYTDEEYSDFDLDCILGDLNGGVEVEWLS